MAGWAEEAQGSFHVKDRIAEENQGDRRRKTPVKKRGGSWRARAQGPLRG